jgi:23S rRNA (guanosine2251-2'-O)-methyltransferase
VNPGPKIKGLKLNAKELRLSSPSKKEIKKIKKNPIYIIVDNVLDTYNVGGIFRLADAVGAKEVILCGETEIPPNSRIKKASINTTEWVNWQYFPSAKDAIESLRSKVKNLTVIAIEQEEKSKRFDEIDYSFPLALVVGHETFGVSKETIDACDYAAEIPMRGVNRSLNVIVSLGIVLFEALKKAISKLSYLREV